MRKYFVLAALIACTAQAQNRSGLEFASAEIRRLQASDAENPGMLWVDQGAKLFAQHCAACHASSMKGVATRYPAVVKGRVVTLETKVRQKMPALAYESDELLALTAYIVHQSRGMPMQAKISEKDVEKGKAAYYQRRGQMNLACAHCHEQNWGKRLGAETLSQGQPNGYPAYRLEWQKMGSLERRIRACMFGLHAELPPYGSDAMLELELFLAWRASGLPIEAPAVRR
jgi:sulfur-oxidizing protein SoxA